MTNLEKYNRVFMEVFLVSEKAFDQEFSNQTIKGWDSIKQLSLITSLEDEFDIMFDTEDIVAFSSYSVGKTILKKYDVMI